MPWHVSPDEPCSSLLSFPYCPNTTWVHGTGLDYLAERKAMGPVFPWPCARAFALVTAASPLVLLAARSPSAGQPHDTHRVASGNHTGTLQQDPALARASAFLVTSVVSLASRSVVAGRVVPHSPGPEHSFTALLVHALPRHQGRSRRDTVQRSGDATVSGARN